MGFSAGGGSGFGGNPGCDGKTALATTVCKGGREEVAGRLGGDGEAFGRRGWRMDWKRLRLAMTP
jgi:hypothetical protein